MLFAREEPNAGSLKASWSWSNIHFKPANPRKSIETVVLHVFRLFRNCVTSLVAKTCVLKIVRLIKVRGRVNKQHKRRGNLQSELQTCKDESAAKERDMCVVCVTLTLLSPCVTRRHVVYNPVSTMLQSEYYLFAKEISKTFFSCVWNIHLQLVCWINVQYPLKLKIFCLFSCSNKRLSFASCDREGK